MDENHDNTVLPPDTDNAMNEDRDDTDPGPASASATKEDEEWFQIAAIAEQRPINDKIHGYLTPFEHSYRKTEEVPVPEILNRILDHVFSLLEDRDEKKMVEGGFPVRGKDEEARARRLWPEVMRWVRRYRTRAIPFVSCIASTDATNWSVRSVGMERLEAYHRVQQRAWPDGRVRERERAERERAEAVEEPS